ncbi:MAG TPA: ATP-binding protein, partial [Clostridia bacterium]|nr:ATP-binding protein [Clostridia bacterium]
MTTNNKSIETIKSELYKLLNASKSLTLYRDLRHISIWQDFESLLEEILKENSTPSLLVDKYYGLINRFLGLSYNTKFFTESWKEWVLHASLHLENNFTLLAEKQGANLSEIMVKALNHDLHCIEKIAHTPWEDIKHLLNRMTGDNDFLDVFSNEDDKGWEDCISSRGLKDWTGDSLVRHYTTKGSGIFSLYNAFYWNGESLEGIQNTDPITLDQLIGYDSKKQILMDNTQKLINGHPANNVLLYGDKGTGKSSMVKALIHKYGTQGLRIIELSKIHMGDYHKILKYTEDRKFKFILYIDDLSFEEHEVEYKHVKALLEGGLKVRPSNLSVYATSNRRHLIKEMVSDREEISSTDSMQEKQSLADRFGITLTFLSPTQKGYLQIVKYMAEEREIYIEEQELYERALKWEKLYNGRSGRT